MTVTLYTHVYLRGNPLLSLLGLIRHASDVKRHCTASIISLLLPEDIRDPIPTLTCSHFIDLICLFPKIYMERYDSQ